MIKRAEQHNSQISIKASFTDSNNISNNNTSHDLGMTSLTSREQPRNLHGLEFKEFYVAA
jgi:hypothetical protein